MFVRSSDLELFKPSDSVPDVLCDGTLPFESFPKMYMYYHRPLRNKVILEDGLKFSSIAYTTIYEAKYLPFCKVRCQTQSYHQDQDFYLGLDFHILCRCHCSNSNLPENYWIPNFFYFSILERCLRNFALLEI